MVHRDLLIVFGALNSTCVFKCVLDLLLSRRHPTNLPKTFFFEPLKSDRKNRLKVNSGIPFFGFGFNMAMGQKRIPKKTYREKQTKTCWSLGVFFLTHSHIPKEH